MTRERPPEDAIEKRAREIESGKGDDPEVTDSESARRAAEAILDESEERVADPAARDPENDTVIRRDSEETAARGDD